MKDDTISEEQMAELTAGRELCNLVLAQLPPGRVSIERLAAFLGGLMGSVSGRNGFEWTHRLLETTGRTLREGERQILSGTGQVKH